MAMAAGCTDAARRAPDVGPAGQEVARSTPAAVALATVPFPAAATPDSVATRALPPGDSLAPLMPRMFHDVCQGESCGIQLTVLACTTLTLHADASDSAPVTGRVAARDTVRVRHRDLHLVAPGVVRIRKSFVLDWDGGLEEERTPRADTVRFTAGDTLYLLHYEELGRWRWWNRGRVSSGDEFWQGALTAHNAGTPVTDSSVAEILSRPVLEEWWRVEGPAAVSGWWHVAHARERAVDLEEMGALESCASGT